MSTEREELPLLGFVGVGSMGGGMVATLLRALYDCPRSGGHEHQDNMGRPPTVLQAGTDGTVAGLATERTPWEPHPLEPSA